MTLYHRITDEEIKKFRQLKQFAKEELKRRIKIARAEGLLKAAKGVLEAEHEFSRKGLVKLIEEVLELIK